MSKIHARDDANLKLTLCGRFVVSPSGAILRNHGCTGGYRPTHERRDEFCRVCFPLTRRSE